jgi:capsular polysaccharide biosynthesis protein
MTEGLIFVIILAFALGTMVSVSVYLVFGGFLDKGIKQLENLGKRFFDMFKVD